MAEVILRGESLRMTYRRGRNSVRALDGVDVEVRAGELVAIVGPSGCGKSTLLHLLAGIDSPGGGRVFLNSAEMSAEAPEERARLRRDHMGLLFQAHALLPGLSITENVALPLALSGVGRFDREARARAALEMVGLADRAGGLPDDLSGGQRQRVALARALVNNPMIVLADEPTGSLDDSTAQTVLEAMIGLLRRQGTGLVMVTHDMQAAARADRIVSLRDGRLDTGSAYSAAAVAQGVFS